MGTRAKQIREYNGVQMKKCVTVSLSQLATRDSFSVCVCVCVCLRSLLTPLHFIVVAGWFEQPISEFEKIFHSGLAIDFVSLRDIEEGEEILIGQWKNMTDRSRI